MNEVSTYYVLNGLVNGERGCLARRAGGDNEPVQKDGHYFLVDDGEADGHGPYDSREDALEAGRKWYSQTWLFPTDGSTPRRSIDDFDDPTGDDNVAVITRNDDGLFFCEIGGSYERVDLTVSAPSFEMAALVYAATLEAHATHC